MVTAKDLIKFLAVTVNVNGCVPTSCIMRQGFFGAQFSRKVGRPMKRCILFVVLILLAGVLPAQEAGNVQLPALPPVLVPPAPAPEPAPVPAKKPEVVQPISQGRDGVYLMPNGESVYDFLINVSVTVYVGEGDDQVTGSGTIFKRGKFIFIQTCGHVAKSLRRQTSVVDPRTGTSKIVVEFGSGTVKAKKKQDGEEVGKYELIFDVFTYSDETREDLALLICRDKDFPAREVSFFKPMNGQKFPSVGSTLIHCGSLHGEKGNNSVLDVQLSQLGVILEGESYDQLSANAASGSSGGGVYTQNGVFCGIIVRGYNTGGIFYMVPMRRIDAWAKRMGIEWVFDPSLPIPSDEEIAKVPIEDIGRSRPFGGRSDRGKKSSDGKAEIEFMIHKEKGSDTIVTKEKKE